MAAIRAQSVEYGAARRKRKAVVCKKVVGETVYEMTVNALGALTFRAFNVEMVSVMLVPVTVRGAAALVVDEL